MRFLRLALLLFSLALQLLLFTSSAHAEWQNASLFPISKNGKWGFIDVRGKQVIPLQFEDTNYFSEGLARVKIGDKYGFIDQTGKLVIPPRYGLVWEFKEGLAYVEDTPAHFIDRTGKTILQTPTSHRFLEFRGGLAQGRPDTGDFGRDYHPPQTYGWINKTGQWAIEPKFKSSWDFTEGLAAVSLDSKKWGYIDTGGKWAIQPRFDKATYFSEGLADVEENGRHYFINKGGERAFAGDYDDTIVFSDGLAAVEVNKKWGFIDHKGKIVVPPTFDQVDTFWNGRAAFQSKGKWGYINKKSEVVVPALYSYAGFFLGDLAPVSIGPDTSDGSGRSYINRDGKVVWSPR